MNMEHVTKVNDTVCVIEKTNRDNTVMTVRYYGETVRINNCKTMTRRDYYTGRFYSEQVRM